MSMSMSMSSCISNLNSPTFAYSDARWIFEAGSCRLNSRVSVHLGKDKSGSGDVMFGLTVSLTWRFRVHKLAPPLSPKRCAVGMIHCSIVSFISESSCFHVFFVCTVHTCKCMHVLVLPHTQFWTISPYLRKSNFVGLHTVYIYYQLSSVRVAIMIFLLACTEQSV